MEPPEVSTHTVAVSVLSMRQKPEDLSAMSRLLPELLQALRKASARSLLWPPGNRQRPLLSTTRLRPNYLPVCR